MNVSLTPEMERRIAEKVEKGLYATASEVVREGLRLLFREDERRADLIAELEAELQVGLDDIERGDILDGPTVMREIDTVLRTAKARGV